MTYLDIIYKNRKEYSEIVHCENTNYPIMKQVTSLLLEPEGEIEGRDLTEIRQGLRNPEKANVVLLGEPGTGKTAITQALAFSEESVGYLVISVEPELFAVGSSDSAMKDTDISNGLSKLVKEIIEYSVQNNVIVVLFIDEFHRIPMISPSSVEALKPILEKSARNGFRILGATTFEEYEEWIVHNRALDQRIIPITIPELPKDVVINILKKRAKLHGVLDKADPNVFEMIYDTSKTILISNAQPRASLDIMLNMIGLVTKSEQMVNGKLIKNYYTTSELKIKSDYLLSRQILNRIIIRTFGIDIDNKVDIKGLKSYIYERLYGQDMAVEIVLDLLVTVYMGFYDPTRPKCSFLSTGTTGVGKTELAKIICEYLKIPMKRFDMSRYSRSEDAQQFADDLVRAAWSAPNAYILLDEVEKSSREAMNILLSVLDDARLASSKNSNRIISFSGNIINLTTNEAQDVFKNVDRSGNGMAIVEMSVVKDALKNSKVFADEILGRLDAIAPFAPLSEEYRKRITLSSLDLNLEEIETDKRIVTISPDIVPFLVRDKVDNSASSGGARDIKRIVRSVILKEVAYYLLNATEELPIALYLDGKARFKYRNISNANNAKLKVCEGHSIEAITKLLNHLGDKLSLKLENKGLFLPKKMTKSMKLRYGYSPNDDVDCDLNFYAQEIIKVLKQKRCFVFKTLIDDDDFVIVGE